MTEPSIVDTWEHLVRFHRATIQDMDDHLRSKFGRSLDDYDVLHQIHLCGGPVKMGDLAERLLVANSSCNRIVGRLEAAGFVSRAPGAEDRRQVFVDLTGEGKRLRRRMAVAHTRDIERLVGAALSASEHRQLRAIMDRLLMRE